ncbi:MAG: hypothetical protein ACI4RT_00310 [Candidatus Spyradenecus sp.]
MDKELEELLKENTDRLKGESPDEYSARMRKKACACARIMTELDPRIKGVFGWGGLKLSEEVKAVIGALNTYSSAATDPNPPEYKGDNEN